MSTDAPAAPTRKKRHVWRWVGLAVLLFLAWFGWQLFGPNPPIIVSRETTYITEPLRSDGLPDYKQYLLDEYRAGVTPENNAAVLLWQVIWPGRLQPNQYAAFVEELGMHEIPSGNMPLRSPRDESYRKSLAKWLTNERGLRDWSGMPLDPESEYVEDVVYGVMSHPWTSEEFPPLTHWVQENQAAINKVVEATRRERYYSPSPLLVDDSRTAIISAISADAPFLRDLSRSLTARAMWHLGEGRPREAWDDLLAAHRLARVIDSRHSMTEQLEAMGMISVANYATVTMLGSDQLDAELASRIQHDLSKLDDMDSMSRVIEHSERIEWLDAALHAKLEGPQFLEGWLQFDASDPALHWSSIDWNAALKGINVWFNRLTAAAGAAKWTDRHTAFQRIDDELKKWKRSTKERFERSTESVSSEWRGQQMADLFASLIAPVYQTASEAVDRTNTQLGLMRVAAALAVFRAEHGEYPDNLDQLVPDTLPELPVDLYHEKPFIYERDGEGFLLYCAGPNGHDDRGSNRIPSTIEGRDIQQLDPSGDQMLWDKIPVDADDVSIRVPVPPFKLPEPHELAPDQ